MQVMATEFDGIGGLMASLTEFDGRGGWQLGLTRQLRDPRGLTGGRLQMRRVAMMAAASDDDTWLSREKKWARR